MSSGPLLTLDELTTGYKYNNRTVVLSSNVTATLKPGTLTFIAGPNGCGKSTLLKTLCGFFSPVKGKILYGSDPLENLSEKDRAGFRSVVLPQSPDTGLLKVKTLITLGLEAGNHRIKSTREQEEEIREQLSLVGLEDFIDRTFSSLSDGEKQKIHIVRALCQRPKLLILDEPTAFLDAAARIEILEILKDISKSRNMAVLFSSHDLSSALNATRSCWILTDEGQFHNYNSSEISEKELLKYFKNSRDK